jgi:hypothetical protein
MYTRTRIARCADDVSVVGCRPDATTTTASAKRRPKRAVDRSSMISGSAQCSHSVRRCKYQCRAWRRGQPYCCICRRSIARDSWSVRRTKIHRASTSYAATMLLLPNLIGEQYRLLAPAIVAANESMNGGRPRPSIIDRSIHSAEACVTGSESKRRRESISITSGRRRRLPNPIMMATLDYILIVTAPFSCSCGLSFIPQTTDHRPSPCQRRS